MFIAQHYSKLSEAGKTQYDKYSEYYEDRRTWQKIVQSRLGTV